MTGVDRIENAQRFAQESLFDYKNACVGRLRDFCAGFAGFLGVVCGRDVRIGQSQITLSAERMSYIDPPLFNEENKRVWTIMSFRTTGHSPIQYEIGCWADRNGDVVLQTADREFEGLEPEAAYADILERLVKSYEGRPGETPDWLNR